MENLWFLIRDYLTEVDYFIFIRCAIVRKKGSAGLIMCIARRVDEARSTSDRHLILVSWYASQKKNYYKTVFNEENKQYETQSKDTVIPVSHVCRWYKINQRSCSTIPISDHIMRRIRMVGSIWQYDLSMCLLTCGFIYFAPVNFRKLGFCNTWS